MIFFVALVRIPSHLEPTTLRFPADVMRELLAPSLAAPVAPIAPGSIVLRLP